MKDGIYDWGKEFLDLNLGDKRLYNRLEKIMTSIAAAPSQSVFLAAGSRSAAKAAYRFLSNDSIDENVLLDSIAAATKEKIKQFEATTILCIQDTTSISFGNRTNIQDMGYYCDSEQKGMNVHSCIAVTQDGLPLGILHQQSHTRKSRKDSSMTKEEKKTRPVEEKESYRWLETIECANQYLPCETKRLHVCDREGDFYELFHLAEKEKESFLVRIVQNRITMDGKRIMDELRQKSAKGSLLVHQGRNPKDNIPARNVLMNFTHERFEIKKPARRKEELSKVLSVTGIHVYETGVPKDKGTSWFLMTNQLITTDQEAVEMIENYEQRWKIERFHYVLKSGCAIEEKQARSYEKLKVLTLLYSVIAMRIMNLTYIGRLFPDLPCSILLEEEEWKLLYCMIKKVKTAPYQCYTLKESILYLGELGGLKGAPSDGMPGAKVLWRGLEKLMFVMEYRQFIV